MKYLSFTFNPVEENTYLLWDEETLEAAIVDAGCWTQREEQLLAETIKAQRLKPRYALQTHSHFDHTFGLPFVYRTYGIKPICQVDDAITYKQMPKMAQQFGLNIQEEMPPIERLLNDGDKLSLGKSSISLIHTPGHTPGSSAYYIPDSNLLFSGDTLFKQSIGRTDLPGGNFNAELDSIRNKLFLLPDDTIVLSGHGPTTTIGWEKQHNYYV